MNVQTAKSFKEIADNWNIGSAKWLRHVSYERSGKYRYNPTNFSQCNFKIFSHSFRFLTFKKNMHLPPFCVVVFRLPITYVLSSMWHGIEPGYYLTFLSIVPVTIAAKKVFFLCISLFLCIHLRFWKKSSHKQLCADILQVRRTIRPYFVGTRYKPLYDVLTGISAWCTINYAMGGFHLLHLKETLQLFR